MVRQEVASAPVCEAANAPTSCRPTTRAATGRLAASRRTAATSRGPVGDGLHVQRHRGRGRVGGQVAEHVGGADVDRVAEPDGEADAVAGLGQQERQRVVDPAAGRDHRDAARADLGHARHEARGQPGRRDEEAAGVRAEQADPGLGGDRRRASPGSPHPGPPASAKPPPQTSAARAPAAAASASAAGQAAAGTQSITRSTGAAAAAAATVGYLALVARVDQGDAATAGR